MDRQDFLTELDALADLLASAAPPEVFAGVPHDLSNFAARIASHWTAEGELLSRLIECLFGVVLAQVPSGPDEPPPAGLESKVQALIDAARESSR